MSEDQVVLSPQIKLISLNYQINVGIVICNCMYLYCYNYLIKLLIGHICQVMLRVTMLALQSLCWDSGSNVGDTVGEGEDSESDFRGGSTSQEAGIGGGSEERDVGGKRVGVATERW